MTVGVYIPDLLLLLRCKIYLMSSVCHVTCIFISAASVINRYDMHVMCQEYCVSYICHTWLAVSRCAIVGIDP